MAKEEYMENIKQRFDAFLLKQAQNHNQKKTN